MKKSLWRKFRAWTPMYWLRTHTINRYHIVNLSGQGGYKWGWIDRDHAILLACFALLDDFMTKEYPGYVDWQADPETKRANTELHLLHFWWKHQRDRELQERDALFSQIHNWSKQQRKINEDQWIDQMNEHFEKMNEHPLREEYDNVSAWVDGRDDEMLKRLMAVRGYLWT